MKNVWISGLAILISASVALAVAPVSDGSLFTDDFSSGDLSKWIQVGTVNGGIAEYDGSVGNPDPAGLGSFHIDSDTGQEAWGRADMLEATGNEWVTEFDFKVSNDVTTGNFWIIYAAYGHLPGVPIGPAIDAEIGIWDNDYIPGFYDGGTVAAWDFHVGGTGLQPRLRADEWHHFTIHHRPDDVLDIYVNDNLLHSGPANNPGTALGDLQIGDVSGGNFFGDTHWDNFSIGGVVPEPATMALLLTGGVLAIRRRKRA
jgi:hypothetical protein